MPGEKSVRIPTADGEASGKLFLGEGKLPGVIHLTDIHGVRPSHEDLARRLSAEGYAVLLPNIFYRVGEPPFWKPPLDFADESKRKKYNELVGSLPPENVARDADAYIDFLASQHGVADGLFAVVGHCFSGAVALRMAAARPDKIAAAASFHGGGLFNDTPTSPHLVLPRVTARLYLGHASNDRSMPAEAIAKLEAALAAWGGRYESETYPAAHGWTASDGQAYDKASADRAFAKLVALLRAWGSAASSS